MVCVGVLDFVWSLECGDSELWREEKKRSQSGKEMGDMLALYFLGGREASDLLESCSPSCHRHGHRSAADVPQMVSPFSVRQKGRFS